uniref:MAX-1A (projected from Caenorhabditis elegans ortholog max-1) n=1 Tax=Strongyloides venezuelensis TaxID=75913 RepID=A0A0K0FTL4_STRVS
MSESESYHSSNINSPMTPEEIISEKSAKIKKWVMNRLQELEDQNERLKAQNLKCTNQLKALSSLAEKQKYWKSNNLNQNFFSQSCIGMLPTSLSKTNFDLTSITNQQTTSGIVGGDCYRTSDDSGLTSDSSGAVICTIMTRSTAPVINCTNTTKSPRTKKRDVRNNYRNERKDDVMSSATDSSPYDEEAKPIPTPRRSNKTNDKNKCNEKVIDIELASNTASIERDSLESPSGDDDDSYNDYGIEVEEDEIFEEIDICKEESGQKFPENCFTNVTPKIVKKDFVKSLSPEYVNMKDIILAKNDNFEEEKSYDCVKRDKCFQDSLLSKDLFNKTIDSNDMPLYSNIDKNKINFASNPLNPIKYPFEDRLQQMAEKCLSIVENDNTPTSSSKHSSGIPETTVTSFNRSESNLSYGDKFVYNSNGKVNSTTMSYCSSTHIPSSSNGNINNNNEYQRPNSYKNDFIKNSPCMSGSSSLRASLVPGRECYEKQGNLTQMTDNRLKSIKRRYFVLKNGYLTIYKNQKSMTREEGLCMHIPMKDIKSIVRITSKNNIKGIQITTNESTLRYHSDSDLGTEEWFLVLTQSLRNATINDLSTREKAIPSIISGWMYKVKNGHQRKHYVSLVDQKLLFFKKYDDKIPTSHIYLHGAFVTEKSRSKLSSDEYSGTSEDDQVTGDDKINNPHLINEIRKKTDINKKGEYSICIEIPNQDPVYLILNNNEDKDKWLYYLKVASRDASLQGSAFEILLQKILIKGSEHINYMLFDDLLLKPNMKENLMEPLISIENKMLAKKAVEMDRAVHLFVTVQMNPNAFQYHVDLAQNIITTAMEDELLKNELYSQLIRMTNGSLTNCNQGWRLLALTLPIFLPKQYALLWFLKQHIRRWYNIKNDDTPIVRYCESLLETCIHSGSRQEPPSKLEAKIILTKDFSISQSNMPFSIPILLPSGDYQMIEFDGTTEIGHSLSSLCLRLNLRPALLSGYALYAQDPLGSPNDLILLKGKQKLCDCISVWEKQITVNGKGKIVEDGSSIKIQLRMRHYWRHLHNDETIMEQLFLCHRMGEEIVKGQIPISNELGEELAALYGQMIFGDYMPSLNIHLDEILEKYYPKKLLDVVCVRSLKVNVLQKWMEFKELSINDCVRMILFALKKWKLFGSFMKGAQMKLPCMQAIFIAINESGVHLLSEKQLEIIRTIPLHSIVSFGEYNNDFMLTMIRQVSPSAHPEETPRERVTFTMDRKSIEQMTIHLAEFIRCQKLIWKLSINH